MAPQSFFKALRQLCDEQRHAACCSTRCRPAWAAPANCSPIRATRRRRRTSMALAKALGGGFPMGACLATAEAAGRHDARHARLDLRRQSARRWRPAMPLLDVMLAPASSITSSACRCCSSRSSPRVVRALSGCDLRGARRGPSRSASRPWCPAGDLVTALREEKLLTVGAGENVVRLLPPLIVNEGRDRGGVARHRARLRRTVGSSAGEKAARS